VAVTAQSIMFMLLSPITATLSTNRQILLTLQHCNAFLFTSWSCDVITPLYYFALQPTRHGDPPLLSPLQAAIFSILKFEIRYLFSAVSSKWFHDVARIWLTYLGR